MILYTARKKLQITNCFYRRATSASTASMNALSSSSPSCKSSYALSISSGVIPCTFARMRSSAVRLCFSFEFSGFIGFATLTSRVTRDDENSFSLPTYAFTASSPVDFKDSNAEVPCGGGPVDGFRWDACMVKALRARVESFFHHPTLTHDSPISRFYPSGDASYEEWTRTSCKKSA